MRCERRIHREVPVKVNAWVDEGVAPLVCALNALDGLTTFDSCEFGADGLACVWFSYGKDWRDLARFINRLAGHLVDEGMASAYTLRLEWFGSSKRPRAELLTRPEHVASVASAIQGLNPRKSPFLTEGACGA